MEILLAKGASLLDKVTCYLNASFTDHVTLVQDEDELTVLHCAAGEGHYAIVNTILAKAPWLANEQSRY